MAQVKQYVIVTDKNVIIRPFTSKKECVTWAKKYAGITEDRPYHIEQVKHIDISSRFNLK